MIKKIPTLQFDNIIIWRHAEAEIAQVDPTKNHSGKNDSGENDAVRELTHKGRGQAKRMAHWLKKHLPDATMLICSPALRALQTAEALDYKIQLQDALKPDASLTEVLSALAKVQNQQATKKPQQNILIVGHQPCMGQLVAYLLDSSLLDSSADDAEKLKRENNTSIKKGAVWWLRLDSADDHLTTNRVYKLLTVQIPSLL